MFLLLFILLPVLEIVAFVEVALAIGWLWALALALCTSVLGIGIARRRGRAALEEVTRAFAERRPPRVVALDGAIGWVGGLLLLVPGFITDVAGALLLLPATRSLARRRLTGRFGGRVFSYAAAAGRYGPARRPADVESTAVEEETGRLPRRG